jgi:alpha-glucosidase
MHPEVLDDVRRLMALRNRLTPYLAKLLRDYRADFEPVVRPLFYDFPNDPKAWTEDELFMLGPDILVAPVTAPGVTSRSLRLPAGAQWRDGWSAMTFEGGEQITLAAPYDQPPFLVRAGGAALL